MKRQQLIHFSGLFAVVLLSVGICFRFFGDILSNPGAFLFGAEGDGLKNYFTVAYQAVHGNGWDFKGMLYDFFAKEWHMNCLCCNEDLYAPNKKVMTKIRLYHTRNECQGGY